MALNRKYAALPDLDSAPDFYETPDLTDDNSTVPATIQSPSEDEQDPDEEAGVLRSRLRVDQARSRFLPSQIDASAVDFSDRVDTKRRSYRSFSRKLRLLPDGTHELQAGLSDDDDEHDDGDDESLERKIARLKRELEEVRERYVHRKGASAVEPTNSETAGWAQLASLSDVLDRLAQAEDASSRGQDSIARLFPAQRPPEPGTAGGIESTESAATYVISYEPSYEKSQTLAKAADFDRRLTVLEKAIGLGTVSGHEFNAPGIQRAILPALTKLHNQVSVLAEASTPSLDTTSRRVRTLTQEIVQLNEARARAETLQAEAAGGSSVDADVDAEQTAKINALYGTLPTIDSLTPLLPPLLDRLRSLRTIHVSAAGASETLDQLQRQQADMAAELKQWRDGLEKVEGAIADAKATMDGNAKFIGSRVRDLEANMAKLS